MPLTFGIRAGRSWVGALMLTGAFACGGTTSEPSQKNLLAGFSAKGAVDSVGRGINQPLSPQGAGFVRGTVLAPSNPGAGNDSLNTAQRIAGVVIRIYPIVGDPQVASPSLGALHATVTTDASGRFQTPVIDGASGWHALTFTPPAGSVYEAVWTRTQFWTGSDQYPWWVTLPRKQ